MVFGLPEKIIQAIVYELGKYKEIEQAILFGSRARGDFRPNSDIDIAVYHKGKLPAGLYSRLDEASGIYKIDLVDMQSLDNEKLRSNIVQQGIVIYPTPGCNTCK